MDIAKRKISMYLNLSAHKQKLKENLKGKQMSNYGPKLAYSNEIHQMKYRSPYETFEDAMNRISASLCDNDAHYHALRKILLSQRFLPAGRIQAAIGSSKAITPYNCFVSGTLADSFVDGENNIMDIAKEAATTMRMGGGIGYDFSTLRPRGAMIEKLQSQSSGAVSFMDIFNSVCKCVSSSGHRRGAQMAVLRVDHPDIEEYINAKHNNHNLTAFNTSIGITDEFMECVKEDAMFDLKWDNRTVRSIRAVTLWDKIMRSTYDWAEPGVLFIDRINEENNLWYCEEICATNPCAEQPLPPYGACLLGSFNLVKYMITNEDCFEFDYEAFKRDIPVIVRAMDNVVDAAIYPLEKQRQEALSKRRMGLGVTGLANAIEAIGFSYGSEYFCEEQANILDTLTGEAYKASIELAKEKGPFPLFDAEKYGKKGFVSNLSGLILHEIKKYGIRNSHLTSIAPTGTISLTADNVSSGIEPVFAYEFTRDLITFNAIRKDTIQDYGIREFGVKGKKSSNVSIEEHLNVLRVAQQYTDSSVSKTCNVPNDISWEDFKAVYMKAWERKCKGCTTYRAGGKKEAVLEEVQEQEVLYCEYDPETGRKTCE